MKLAVIGSRSWADKNLSTLIKASHKAQVFNELDKIKDKITLIISGGALGPDSWAVEWAKQAGIKYQEIPAAWEDLVTPPVVIRRNSYGKEYNLLAGKNRNTLIIQAADEVWAFWDGKSGGTKDSLDKAQSLGKPIQIFYNKK